MTGRRVAELERECRELREQHAAMQRAYWLASSWTYALLMVVGEALRAGERAVDERRAA